MRNRRAFITVIAGGPSDTTAPTVVITCTESSPTPLNVVPITITFSEAVTGFVVGDIAVVGCTLSNFVTANNIVFTVNATFTALSATLDIAAGVCTDAAGNENEAAAQFAITSLMLLQDAFTDTNGTDLNVHTPSVDIVGGGWAVVSEGATVIEIQSNKAVCTGAEGSGVRTYAVADVSDANVLIRGKIRISATGGSGLICRWQDVNNHLLFWVTPGNPGALNFYKREGGATASLGNSTATVVVGTEYEMMVTLDGNTIKCYFDGVLKIEVTSALFNDKTKFGLRTNDVACSVDDLEIYNTTDPGTIPDLRPTPAGAGEFMLVHMADTHYGSSANDALHAAMTQFLEDYADSLGVEMVMHSGDFINPPLDPGSAAQWGAADVMMGNLDTAEIPYLAAVGNHDYDDDTGSDTTSRATTNFNTYFPQSRYTAHGWWSGGFFEAGKTENAYCLLTIGGTNWIFISLEFGPRDAVLAWADALLTTYAARHAVIMTHSFMYRDGTRTSTGDQYNPHGYTLDGDINDGGEMWLTLKTHDNIRLVLSGHDIGGTSGSTLGTIAQRVDNSDGGVPINQILANYQEVASYGSGYMRFMRINPTAKTITVETYSPFTLFLRDAANEFLVDWTP